MSVPFVPFKLCVPFTSQRHQLEWDRLLNGGRGPPARRLGTPVNRRAGPSRSSPGLTLSSGVCRCNFSLKYSRRVLMSQTLPVPGETESGRSRYAPSSQRPVRYPGPISILVNIYMSIYIYITCGPPQLPGHSYRPSTLVLGLFHRI
jgi:hypothetical protein